MCKSSEIKLVGQPILKQILDLLSVINLEGLIKRHEADRYYKFFKSRTHLITMLFGILSRCDSMEEMQKEVLAWQEHRNNKNAVINWQFTTKDARIKLRRLYPSYNN